MSLWDQIRRLLLNLRAWSSEIQRAIQERAEAEHIGEERNREQQFPPDKVSAIIAFDDQTVRTMKAEAERQYRTQNSIKKAAWSAFGAASIYALISLLMWCQMVKQSRIANEVLRRSIDSFRVDERAWVELEPIKGTMFSTRTEKIGAGFSYPIYVKNVGKTVARDVQLRASRQGSQSSIRTGDSAESLSFIQDKLLLGKVPTASDIPIIIAIPRVLAPNAVSAVPAVLNGQEPQYVAKDEWVSYIIGRVDYTDEFGVSHWLKFCYFVVNARGDLWNCTEGNDEDRNPENAQRKPN